MAKGRYGIHGGQYIPETLMNEVNKLEEAYEFFKKDSEFNQELDTLLKEYAKRHENIKRGFARAVGQFIYFSNTNWDENVYNNAVWKNINDIVK